MQQVMQMAAQGRAQDLVRDLRCRALFSSYYLTKVVLGYSSLVDHLHGVEMEEFLRKWEEGVTKQWIEWPRGFFKTTSFTIGTAIWVPLPPTPNDKDYALDRLGFSEEQWDRRVALHNQDVTQLLAFETIDNAKKKVGEVRWHFEENALFRSLFPEIAWEGHESPWNNSCLKIRRTAFGQRAQEGTFEAIGVGGALQSRHYDLAWEDDLVGKKARDSRVEMDKTIAWHLLLNGAFVQASKQIRTGVSNVWGYHDLNRYVQENEPDYHFHSRSAAEMDDVQGKEVPIFPERMNFKELEKIRTNGSMTIRDFTYQYYNRRLPLGEQEVDIKLLHTYTVNEKGQLMCSCGAKWRVSELFRGIGYDPYNAKGTASTSRPAIFVVGGAPDKHVFALDYYQSKGDYSKVYEHLYNMNDVWMPEVLVYEDVGHQNLTHFHIREQEKNPEHLRKHKRFRRIDGRTTGGRSKEVRIREVVVSLLELGRLSIRSSMSHLREQLLSFPYDVPDHDYDLLDALEDVVPAISFPATRQEEEKEQSAEDEFVDQLGKSYSFVREATV